MLFNQQLVIMISADVEKKTEMTNAAKNLAGNIRQLREQRGLTQHQVAQLSEIPRPTLASLESGAANPTLSVLTKVAFALQVSIEELIGAPRSQVQLFKAGFGKSRKRAGGTINHLLPEAIPGLEISRIELFPGGQLTGVPHTSGTREYLTCESGKIELIVSGEHWLLEAGDSIVFRGDQRHSYNNPDIRIKCLAISVVCFSI